MNLLLKKSILFCNNDGEYSIHSTQELINSSLNRWKGWKCSAGITNLYITADGNIYTGTCKVGGLKGNVFDKGVVYPDQWITCTKDDCSYAPEMQLFRSKEHNDQVSKDDLKVYSPERVIPTWTGPFDANGINNYPLTITWNLGRRCNYVCSYCSSSLSNTFEVNKSYGSLMFAIENIQKLFCKDKKALWIFTGGEPTINPSYLQIVKYLNKELGHKIQTHSNGSLDGAYFRELTEYSEIVLSAHLNQFSKDEFVNNCHFILEKKLISKNKFIIKIMTPPTKLEEAQELMNEIKSLPNSCLIDSIELIHL